MSAAGRKRVKAALARQAARAFSDVFDKVAPMAAQESPKGSVKPFVRWHLQAFRRELEDREEQAKREGWLP